MTNNPTNLVCDSEKITDYLAESDTIDFRDSAIENLANSLASNSNDPIKLAQTAYEFVRDQIAHSCDIESQTITCEASRVLKHQEGICFAKSHLLAALLRTLKIPSGFCYQKLVFDDSDPNFFTLHGLNAIYLEPLEKWIRVDARGNKPGVNAQFSLGPEMLAFPVRSEWLEIDYPTIYPQPNLEVITALKCHQNLRDLLRNLPSDL